jgi:hypothetical protein
MHLRFMTHFGYFHVYEPQIFETRMKEKLTCYNHFFIKCNSGYSKNLYVYGFNMWKTRYMQNFDRGYS